MNLRVDADIYNWVCKKARQDDVSPAREINILLRKAMQAEKQNEQRIVKDLKK